MESSDTEDFADLYGGADDFYRAVERPANKLLQYRRPSDGKTICFQVVGHHVLWANFLWNGSRWLCNYIDLNPLEFKGKTILELGAGAALPSIMAVLADAQVVVSTDYPDKELIEVIKSNADSIVPANRRDCLKSIGYLWGSDSSELLAETKEGAFDMIFLCDLIFNHSEHRALLKTIHQCLSRNGGIAWCVFSHYRPWLRERDLELLRIAQEEFNLSVTLVEEAKFEELVIEDHRLTDPEETKIVYAYQIRWAAQ